MGNAIPVFVFVLFSKYFLLANSEVLSSLNGKWLLADSKASYEDVDVVVPGGIYSDLMIKDIVEDVFYGNGDNKSTWVPALNWSYYQGFNLDQDLVKYTNNVNLVIEGLDTYSSIIWFDTAGSAFSFETKNMFVQYVFNIRDAFQTIYNVVQITIRSPLEISRQLSAEQNKSYPIPPQCPAAASHGQCHINMVRKMQSSFSGEWGPSFPSEGLWKNIYVEYYNTTRIRYVMADISDQDGSDIWYVNVITYFANTNLTYVKGRLNYTIEANGVVIENTEFGVTLAADEYNELKYSYTLQIIKSQVKTWWPNGYGEPAIYNLTVRYTDADWQEPSTKTVTIGFRIIELVQNDIGKIIKEHKDPRGNTRGKWPNIGYIFVEDSGSSFYLKVNDVPMFMKGANLMPISILPEWAQNQSTIRNLLTSARDANMNMLRVWGGGIYESDYFYDVADELGILIWQDFMFTDALYPANDEFLGEVIAEVNHNVKRLQSHPCIALYSGNNANELLLTSSEFVGHDNFTLYKDDYLKLVTSIKEELKRITNGRAYFVNSSPSNGKLNEDYISVDPNSNFYGDVHYFNYTSNPFDVSTYPIPRFASEYGYQSLPSWETWLTANKNESDLKVNGDFINNRQHRPNGMAEVKALISANFDLPDESSTNYDSIFIYLSQVYQAQAVKMQSEHYRSRMSILDSQGQGNTMGALYWHLNDVWVAPTWSSIDYEGRWKMLHYFTVNFFAPVLVTGEINPQGNLDIYVVSDLLKSIDYTVYMQVFNWNSLTALEQQSFPAKLNATQSKLISTIVLDEHLVNVGCGTTSAEAKNNCFIYLTIESEFKEFLNYNYVLPSILKNTPIKQANVKITSITRTSTPNVYSVALSTDNIALFVWLDSHDIRGRFSDNGFALVAASKTVLFHSEVDLQVDELEKSLTVTSLSDLQNASQIFSISP